MIEYNLQLLANHDIGGFPNTGEGMAMKVTPDGRRFLYIANENPPVAFSVLDVSDPREPKLVWQLPTPHGEVRGNSLALRGDLLLTAWQVKRPGLQPAGFTVWDVSNPIEPRQVSFFDCSGPYSRGVHYVSFMDGRYAHITTGAADFEPQYRKDDQFYMIVDLEDPSHPREVGRWWMSGQRVGDTEPLPERSPAPYDAGFRPHHCLSWPERPDRAYLGYINGGIVILDISDRSRPQLVSQFDYDPPFHGFCHTVVPLFDRGLMLVADESLEDLPGVPWDTFVWIVDIRNERQPIPISTIPTPRGFDGLLRRGGRLATHNIHENETEPGSAKLQNTVVSTWLGGGLRVYDIRDPFRPEETAVFLPETPPGQLGSMISDVFVDDRQIIYAADRELGGLYVLEYTGTLPLD